MKLFRCDTAEVNTAFLKGEWHPHLVDAALTQAQASEKSHDWISYLDICCSIQGMTHKKWQHAAQSYRNSNLYSRILFLKLVNLTLTPNAIRDADEPDDCENTYLLRKLGKPGLSASLSDIYHSGYLGTQISHYPLLLTTEDTLWRSRFSAARRERVFYAKAEELQSRVTTFEQLVSKLLEINKANKFSAIQPRIAVVGNSPGIIGKELGREIDDADIVVRFNRVSQNIQHHEHIGKKTDLWVMSPSTPVKHCPKDAKGIVVSGLNALTRPSFYWRTLPGLNRSLSEMPQYIWHSLVSRFHSPPSAGTLLLASLKSLPGNLNIQCYGFTSSTAELIHLPNHYADKKPRSVRHNWKKEANWLKENFPSIG